MVKVKVQCKKCKQLLRVPSELGNIAVTCPKCRHRWDEYGAVLKKLSMGAASGAAWYAGNQAAQAADPYATGVATADVASQAGGDVSELVDGIVEILGGLLGG